MCESGRPSGVLDHRRGPGGTSGAPPQARVGRIQPPGVRNTGPYVGTLGAFCRSLGVSIGEVMRGPAADLMFWMKYTERMKEAKEEANKWQASREV